MFKPMFPHLFVFAVLFILSACSPDSKRTVDTQDYISDDVFTSGIEGPAVAADGILYAVNYARESTIGRVEAKNQAELFVELPSGSTGNGIRFASDGSMFIADYVGHNILKVNMESREISVYAHSDQMNQPNDLAIAADGTIYASDPDWENKTGKLWRVDVDGSVQLLEENMGTTNGIEVSVDEKSLYVNESVQRVVWVYKILPDGSLADKRKLIEFDDHGLDGMRSDSQGNLFIARYDAGVVAVVSPDGVLLREVRLSGQKPTNIAFGGDEGKTVFVTMQDRGAIEYFMSDYPGRAWVLRQR